MNYIPFPRLTRIKNVMCMIACELNKKLTIFVQNYLVVPNNFVTHTHTHTHTHTIFLKIK